MRRELSEHFLELVSRSVIEDAAFLFLENGEVAALSGAVLEGSVDIVDPVRARVRLRVDAPLAAEIAANMLGLGPDEPREAANDSDAVGELTNILAGALATQIVGSRALATLAVPKVAEARLPLDEAPPTIATTFVTEGGHPLEVALFMRGS